jgi:outer membrane protein
MLFLSHPRRCAVPAPATNNKPPRRWQHVFVVVVMLASLRLAATPLSLDDAIRAALEHNQRIKVSAFSPQISRADVLTAYGTFDPVLTFSRSYGKTDSPIAINPLVTRFTQTDNYGLSVDGQTPWGLIYSVGASASNSRGPWSTFADNYETFGGVKITQPLLRGFGFGANLRALRVAKANRSTSDWQHRQTVIDTVTGVILAYNNLIQARDNVRIARRSRELAAQLLDDNEKRHRVGALSDADVTQARARVANREESILLAEQTAKIVENQLRELIGDTRFIGEAPLEIVPLAPIEDTAIAPASELKRAYDLRPDYQAARLGITIQRANNAAAQNSLLPRLDFVGTYGYSGLSSDFAASRRQVRDRDYLSSSAGVVVTVPLTFAEGRGRARAARLGLRRAEADLVRLEQDIAVSVAAAAVQIDTTRQRVAATLTAYELAKQALDAEQKRFKAGTSNTFFVLQLQEQLADVENRYAQALADQRRARATYEREIATTLASHNIKTE